MSTVSVILTPLSVSNVFAGHRGNHDELQKQWQILEEWTWRLMTHRSVRRTQYVQVCGGFMLELACLSVHLHNELHRQIFFHSSLYSLQNDLPKPNTRTPFLQSGCTPRINNNKVSSPLGAGLPWSVISRSAWRKHFWLWSKSGGFSYSGALLRCRAKV